MNEINGLECAFSEESLNPCKKQAEAKITYGMYSAYENGRPHHCLLLCKDHIAELWDKCRAPVTAGFMHWVIEPADSEQVEQLAGSSDRKPDPFGA